MRASLRVVKPPAPIRLGMHAVEVPCPRCGDVTVLTLVLGGQLVTPTDDVPQLKLRARSKPAEHRCNQSPLFGPGTVDPEQPDT